MMPDRLEQIERIVLTLLDVPASDRARLLDEWCRGDPDLRREAETLLAGQNTAEALLRTPAPGAARLLLRAVAREALIGRSLGPYRIEAPLGAGGMGQVYRAHDAKLGREVALKVLPPDLATDPDRLARFEREARLLAGLSHPAILTIHDIGIHDAVPYVVTELLEGETLREVLTRRQPTWREVLGIALQAAQGLAAAHRQGIVHRDLKPENLFLTSDGRLKILDFGLAKRAPASPPSAGEPIDTATEPGILVGTAAYMAPEQVQGRAVDARADVFAFGIVLYELLTTRHPYRQDTLAGTLDAILHESPPSLAALVPELPPAISGIVQRCLGKAREDRYPDASALAQALGAATEAIQEAEGPRRADEPTPYPGLRSFTEQEAHLFVGREAEVASLWHRIRDHRLVGVIGPSGAGKTSFVRAGVLPERPDGWAAIVCSPGPAPLGGLGQALAPALASDPDALSRLNAFEDPEVAVALLRRWRDRHASALIVVDHLEELFTLTPPVAQAQFADLLGRLIAEGDTHVVLVVRDDFLMHCSQLPPLAPVLGQLTALLPLSRDAKRRALVEPAAALGYRFEPPSLADEMVAAVEESREPLPLLAFAVARLWERRDRERACLTRDAYLEIGGVAGAVARHAEDTLARIGAGHERTVREVFRQLVTAQGTRAVIEWDDLLTVVPDREAGEHVLQALVDARLLTSCEVAGTGGRPSRHRVAIAHESLVTVWPRLGRWRAQDADSDRLRALRRPDGRLPNAWRRWIGFVSAIVLATAFGAALALWLPRAEGPAPVVRSELSVRPAETLDAGGFPGVPTTTAGGTRTALRWTRDGTALVFVGRRGGVQQLFVRPLDAVEARPLAGTEDARVPAISADGQWIAFWAANALKKVPVTGDPVVEVQRLDVPPTGLVWDHRGGLLFSISHSHIQQAGTETPLTTLGKTERAHVVSAVLPDERTVLFTVRKRTFTWGDEVVEALDLPTGRRKLLLRDAADARYVPTGHLVFLRSNVLYAVPFDMHAVEVAGAPSPILQGIAQALSGGLSGDMTGAGQFDIAATGALAWVPGGVERPPARSIVTVDVRGHVSPGASPFRDYGPGLRVSPDGRQAAVTVRTNREQGLWLYDLERGTLNPLVQRGEVWTPLWSLDGRDVFFHWLDGGQYLLARQLADTNAQPEVLAEGWFHAGSLGPDRELVGTSGWDASWDLGVVRVGDQARGIEPLIASPAWEGWPEVSPDGQWLAYVSNASGRYEVYVQPYSVRGVAPTVVSLDGGTSPSWHPGGGQLFYLEGAYEPQTKGRMMVVQFAGGSPPRVGRPMPLFEFDPARLRFVCRPMRCYDVARDGKRFYVIHTPAPPSSPAVTHVSLVQNWFQELQAKVPAAK